MKTDLRQLLVDEGRKKKRHAYRISGPTLCKEPGCVRPAEIWGRCRNHEQSIRRGSRRSQVKKLTFHVPTPLRMGTIDRIT